MPSAWSMHRGLAGRAGTAFVTDWVKWGAGLRASQALILAGKARALIHGRYHVSVSDIQALALPVLAPPGDSEFLRRVRARHARHDRRQAARGGAAAAERDVADARDRPRLAS